MSVTRSPLKMTAEQCRRAQDAVRRTSLCLPQDIEYWQFYIDFHTHGQAYAESRMKGSPTQRSHDSMSAPNKVRIRVKAGSSAIPKPPVSAS